MVVVQRSRSPGVSAKRPVRGQQTGQPSSNHVHDRGSFDQSLLMCVALSYKKRVNVPFYSYDLCEKYKQYLPVRRGSTSTPQRSTLAAGKCHECNVDDRTLRQVSHSVYHSLVSSYNELNQLAVNIPWQSFRAASTSPQTPRPVRQQPLRGLKKPLPVCPRFTPLERACSAPRVGTPL